MRRFVVNKRTKLPLPQEPSIRDVQEETRAQFLERLQKERAEMLQRWCDENVYAVASLCPPDKYKEALLLLRKKFCQETGRIDPLSESLAEEER